MQFFIEMEMNSAGHTTQHFNCVQEEWANKKAIIFILKVRKSKQIPNSLLKDKEIQSITSLDAGKWGGHLAASVSAEELTRGHWFNAKEPRWAGDTKGKVKIRQVHETWSHSINATDLPTSGSTA